MEKERSQPLSVLEVVQMLGAVLISAGVLLGLQVLAGGALLVIRPPAGRAFARFLARANVDIVHHFAAALGTAVLLFLGGVVIIYVTGRLAMARREIRSPHPDE